jgi:hypothetical protein
LIIRYWRYAKTYYVKNGKPTSETYAIKLALRFVRGLYGTTPAAEFTPKKLKAVREAMITHEIAREVKVVDAETGAVTCVRKGMARKCVTRLRRNLRPIVHPGRPHFERGPRPAKARPGS